MIFNNNTAWPGISTIIYRTTVPGIESNIESNIDYSDDENTMYIKFNGIKELIDIGLLYKGPHDSDFTEESFVDLNALNDSNSPRIEIINSLKFSTDKDLEGNAIGFQANGYIFYILNGLTADSFYTIRTYIKYKDSLSTSKEYYYNECKVKTLPYAPNSVTIEEVAITYRASSHFTGREGELDEYKCNCKQWLESCFRRLSYFYGKSNEGTRTVSPKLDYEDYGWEATSSYEFNLRATSLFNNQQSFSTVAIHEIAHNYVQNESATFNESKIISFDPLVIKFMEFVTGVEGATWGEFGGHIYPTISSARYDYLRDTFVLAACGLNREKHLTEEDMQNFNTWYNTVIAS